MNSLRSIMCAFSRGYARQSNRQVKSLDFRQKRSKLTEEELYQNVVDDPEFEENFEDLGNAETDFSTLGLSYKEHLMEMEHSKELLKMRIVARKYGKSDDPVFITWAEKEQIQSLNQKNSEEWTPERLSESFPVLPENIRKILRANWMSHSAERVIKHDLRVIENWKKFREGTLAVDPKLEDHLKKFKDRKIDIENLALNAEKYVRPPLTFPPPKCQTYSNVVRGYIEQPEKIKKKLADKPLLQLMDKTYEKDFHKKKVTQVNNEHGDKNKVSLDVFFEKKVDQVAGKKKLSVENQLIVDEYKRKKSIDVFENDFTKISECQEEKKSSSVMTTEQSPTINIKVPQFDIKESSLDTGIIEWKKKEASSDDYPQFIKVPRAKAKSGVTFRVQDRYYDTDGEFLYRVPGLKP